MASGHTGNVVPRKGLWVRVPCPPLRFHPVIAGVFSLFGGLNSRLSTNLLQSDSFAPSQGRFGRHPRVTF